MERETAIADKITLHDLGNGLIILGLILLVVYVALATLSLFVYAEGAWKVWTYPHMLGLSTAAILFLLVVGAILRYLPSSNP